MPGAADMLAAWSETAKVFAVGGALMVGIVALGLGVRWLRRRFHPTAGQQLRRGSGFTMEELEDMRSGGKISPEEFRSLRRKLFGLDSPRGPADNSASSAPRRDDDDGTVRPDGGARAG